MSGIAKGNGKWWLIGGVVTLGLLYYFNSGKRFMAYLTYSLKSFQVRSVNLTSIVCRISIDISNPSEMAVSIDDYRLEVNYLKPDNTKALLAQSPVNKLSIAARGNTTVTTDVSISIFTLGKFITNLTKKILSTKEVSVVDTITNELRSRITVVVKATVLGQFIQKEFKA